MTIVLPLMVHMVSGITLTLMPTGIEQVVQVLDDVTREVEEAFGSLNATQLNWAPGPKRWSVAQCLDHLMTTNALYLPVFHELAAGRHQPGVWARISPFSGFFGRLLIRSLDPANVKPMKTTARAEPSRSTLPADIVSRFVAHQRELSSAMRALPSTLDVNTTMASPLLGFVTYSVADGLRIIALHEQRHLGQAQRVTQAPGFPRT